MSLKLLFKKDLVFLLFLLVCGAKLVSSTENDADAQPTKDDETNLEEEDPQLEDKYYNKPGVKKLSFKPANLTEEDHHSTHMPRDLLCDGCRIVAYVITKKMKKVQKRYKKGHKLSESDIIDLLDDVCRDKEEVFGSYGIKEVKGIRRLSGEGLETKDSPGVLQGGGRWPGRLREMCQEYVGDLGEEVIYDHFLQNLSLENLFCHNKALGNYVCQPKQEKAKSAKTLADEL